MFSYFSLEFLRCVSASEKHTRRSDMIELSSLLFIIKLGRLLSSTPPHCFGIISINFVLSLHSKWLLWSTLTVFAVVCVCHTCVTLANKCDWVMTLFGSTGRLCCIARALVIHETITLSVSIPEVINMSVASSRSELPQEKYALWICDHLSMLCVWIAQINQFPLDLQDVHGQLCMLFQTSVYRSHSGPLIKLPIQSVVYWKEGKTALYLLNVDISLWFSITRGQFRGRVS